MFAYNTWYMLRERIKNMSVFFKIGHPQSAVPDFLVETAWEHRSVRDRLSSEYRTFRTIVKRVGWHDFDDTNLGNLPPEEATLLRLELFLRFLKLSKSSFSLGFAKSLFDIQIPFARNWLSVSAERSTIMDRHIINTLVGQRTDAIKARGGGDAAHLWARSIFNIAYFAHTQVWDPTGEVYRHLGLPLGPLISKSPDFPRLLEHRQRLPLSPKI